MSATVINPIGDKKAQHALSVEIIYIVWTLSYFEVIIFISRNCRNGNWNNEGRPGWLGDSR
jgi:hypothetical protein